jgi:DNA-binding NarL/FixJ family response regulator
MARRCFVIADDHPLFRKALKQTVSGMLKNAAIAEAGTFAQLSKILESRDDIDLVLLDLRMPGVQGLSGLVYMRSQYPQVPVVVVSGIEERALMRRALDLGASGFIPKSSPVEEMQLAINMVLSGDIWVPPGLELEATHDGEAEALARRLTTLTPQQARVLMMLREGLLNKQIAYQLGVSEATVKAHVSAILQKLQVDSRTQAVIAASRIDGEPLASPPG